MKRLSTVSLLLVSALILTLLSGCILNTGSIVFTYSGEERLSESQNLFVRYSDGGVYQVPKSGNASDTAQTDSSRTTVGGYVYDGVVSWVPNYNYNYFDSVYVSGINSNATKPLTAVDHVVLAEQKMDDVNSGYVDVTFNVYDANGQLVGGRTEIFVHSLDPSLVFYNTDPMDTNKTPNVTGGFSSYTVNGSVTFQIKFNPSNNVDRYISLYSGPQLITDIVIHPATDIQVSGGEYGSSLPVGTSLNMSAGILPESSFIKAVIWTVENGTGQATIDKNGVLTTVSPGTVTVKATAVDGSGVIGTNNFTILEANVPLPVEEITVMAPNGVTTVPTNASLTLTTTVAPVEAANQEVVWSVVNGSGTATINETTGELTAGNPGTVTVKAAATDGSGVVGSLQLTVTSINVLVTSVTLTGSASVQVGSSIPFTETVAPDHATDQAVTWSVVPGTGQATINANGELTAVTAGTVTVKATAVDGSDVVGTKEVTITEVPHSGDGEPATPTPTPTPTPASVEVPMVAPTPTVAPSPTAQPNLKFDDKVVQVEKVLGNLNKKVEEAKTHPTTVTFKDTSAHWADATVNIFVKLGIVNGYIDGTFQPDANITRAEFATLISKVFDLSVTGSGKKLSDSSGHWAEAAINALTDHGVISGYEDGTFKPNQAISRAEIIAMISKIINLSTINVAEAPAFSDLGGAWNKNQIEQAAAAGIISGEGDGQFLPNKQSSRAEALTILLHVLQTNPELKTLLGTIQ